jgi:hypothetical protein
MFSIIRVSIQEPPSKGSNLAIQQYGNLVQVTNLKKAHGNSAIQQLGNSGKSIQTTVHSAAEPQTTATCNSE